MSATTPLLDSHKLNRIGGQIGTNPAGVFEDSLGQKYYIKTLESPMHARNEYIAAMLYQLAGAPTLTYVQTQDPCQIATKWQELDKHHLNHFNDEEIKQAQRWFAVHAWTANWDAAGYEGDNQGVFQGKVLTLDVGGALNYRAFGDPKGKAFSTEVNELDTLRSDTDNPHAVKLFATMSVTQLQQAISIITSIPDATIEQTILDNQGSEKLAHKMIARKYFIQRYKVKGS